MKASEARALLENKFKDEIDKLMERIYTDITIASLLNGSCKTSWWPNHEEEPLAFTVVRKLKENGYTVSHMKDVITIFW